MALPGQARPACGEFSLPTCRRWDAYSIPRSRALAQQLSIRIGKHYSQTRLVEVNSHSLFSRYFSESGKLVGKLFDDIESTLDEGVDTFVCVLMDEVESLTSAREQAARGMEPNDAMRVCFPPMPAATFIGIAEIDQAVNALLTALDRLRNHTNVLVLCTSNLIMALVSNQICGSNGRLISMVGLSVSGSG